MKPSSFEENLKAMWILEPQTKAADSNTKLPIKKILITVQFCALKSKEKNQIVA